MSKDTPDTIRDILENLVELYGPDKRYSSANVDEAETAINAYIADHFTINTRVSKKS